MSILYVSCDTLCMMNHSLDHFIIMTPNLLSGDSRSSIQVTGWHAHVMRCLGEMHGFMIIHHLLLSVEFIIVKKYAVCFMLVCKFSTHG